ncbi:hypothetical protein AB0H37_24665 [Actinomadura sp. NPDC023710]|uniref:hypothetical protein n=1 Tax=Actinomadura sp. NPDC023710 TaxID=3158219 RepID=UPI0034031831
MEIVIRLCGTPDELARFDLRAWLAIQTPDAVQSPPVPDLPQQVEDYLAQAPSTDRTREHVHTFLAHMLADPRTQYDFGRSQGTQRGEPPYVQLRHTGKQRVGAYARVRPRGYINFRLPPSEADGYAHARAAELSTTENPYGVNLTLNSGDAVDDALELAAKARLRAARQ